MSVDAIRRSGRRPVVCFVDDDDHLRESIARLLRRRRFDVLTAGTAADAAELIETHEGEIDALLMDINLPDGWGASLAPRLQMARPEMVVVYTTGFAGVDPILAGGLREAEHVVEKPFKVDQLVEVLEKAIAARREEPDG